MALVKDLADNTANFIWNVDHSYPGMYTALSLNKKRNRRIEQKHYIIRGGEEDGSGCTFPTCDFRVNDIYIG
jgi:hypothetical protein